MSPDPIEDGAEEAGRLALAFLRTADEALAVHGDDPESGPILAASIFLMIKRAGAKYPALRETVRLMLEARS